MTQPTGDATVGDEILIIRLSAGMAPADAEAFEQRVRDLVADAGGHHAVVVVPAAQRITECPLRPVPFDSDDLRGGEMPQPRRWSYPVC